MLLSFNWLKQYLPELGQFTAEEVAERITASLTEVEGYTKRSEGLSGIVIGEIKKISKHPKKEKLSVCVVDDGHSEKQIVCGANNLFEGAYVAVCRVGGTVLNPEEQIGEQSTVQIGEREVAGVKSQGMICSLKELGVAEEHKGIWILPEGSIVGSDLVPYLKDTVFEIENKQLTHRPDAFSHQGIAREISAILKTPFKKLDDKTPLIPTQELPFQVEIKNKELCIRFSALVMAGVKVQPSPAWLQLRLLSVGVRPINNIVDVTNYIMMDMGQPMHAYDYDKIHDHKLIVRNAKEGEKFSGLDEKEYELTKDMIIVGDSKEGHDLAGILGGKGSEITDKTKNVILEAANWEMFNNRRTARKLGIRTEANTRFEKGQDPNMTQEALERGVHLISDLTRAEVASDFLDIYPEPRQNQVLEFDLNAVKRLLGIEVTKDQIIEILEGLEIEIHGAEKVKQNMMDPIHHGNKVELVIPSFRQDLNLTEDVVEEIGRIYGYDKIKPTLPSRSLRSVKVNEIEEFSKKVKDILTSLGLDEIYTYAFTSKEAYDKANLDINSCIKIQNPLAPELGYFRNSLTPSHLEKLSFNLANFDNVGFFEVSRVALKEKDENDLPKQPWKVAGVLSSKSKDINIYQELKAVTDELLNRLRIEDVKYVNLKDFRQVDPRRFHPVRSAEITINGKSIGTVGELHPVVAENFEIKARTAIFEIDFQALMTHSQKEPTLKPISSYQKVTRDISFWVTKETEIFEILASVQSTKPEMVTEVNFVEVFEDPKKKEEKSVTLSVHIQPEDKTLTDKEIEEVIKEVLASLEKSFKIRQRK